MREMRRKDRALSEQDSLEILDNGKYGVLSLSGEDGYPYGVPMHYVMIDGVPYFHGSSEGGYKTESYTKSKKASFTVIETADGVKARSVIVFGAIEEMSNMREIVLEKFVEKFVPDFAWEQAKAGIPFAKNAMQAFCIKIDYVTGKWVDKPDGK